MKYMMIFSETQKELDVQNDPEKSGPYWGAWGAYVGAVAESGVMVSGEGLQPPSTATMVRVRDGKREIHDGPYAESKEMVGGFFIIDVPNLDVALEWAARSPAASHGSVEVRPVMPPSSPS